MAKEIEARFRIKNDQYEELLREFSSLGKVRLFFERNRLFDSKDNRITRNGKTLRFRLRRYKTGKLVYYRCYVALKSPDEGKIFREKEENEPPLNRFQFNRLQEIFRELGFEEIFVYDKKVSEVFKEAETVSLAELPIVGFWLEIEGTRAGIRRLAKELGLRMKDVEKRSYRQIYLDWCEVNGIEPSDRLTFEEEE